MRVLAQQGDSVDSLCWRHLGSTDPVEATLESNPGLAAKGAILPMGTEVILPDDVSSSSAKTQNIIKLWD